MVTNKPEYMRLYMRNYRRKGYNRIIQTLGGQCIKCFTTKNLEIHHIKPISRNGNHDCFHQITKIFHRYTDRNICLLCADCHDLRNGPEDVQRAHFHRFVSMERLKI